MGEDDVSHLAQAASQLELNDGAKDPFSAYDPAPPPTPKLKSKGVIATDITEQFTIAAQHLDAGQLIKDPYFTLFESVGALEIMDPKMDSGFLEPGETMDDEYDFSQPLLPEEIAGIIDQLICHEMAWHMGHPLAQTIFTSVYIDRILSPCPLTLQDTHFDRSESCSEDESLALRILRAYCIGLIKTCFYVNSRVKAEHYYEEEDFVTHIFTRSLLDDIDHEPILQLLEMTAEQLNESEEFTSELKQALDCRLRLRINFLRVVEMADSRSAKGVKELWSTLLASVSGVKSTTELGTPVPSSFSDKIQRKLASTVPPRSIVEVSKEAALDHLERLCRDAAIVVEVLEYHDSHSLMTFVFLFQSRKPQPSVYVRTLLQHYLFGEMVILGSMSIRQLLDDDLAATVLPVHQLLDRHNDEIEVPTDPRFKMAERMELFRQRAAGSYLDILRTICQNRCRIRRTLCHTIADWDNLQLDAEELDQELRIFTKEEAIVDAEISSEAIFAFPLSSWAYLYKLRQMEWIVQMGFELEVYQPDELAGMYWYVQYLAKTRARHLERIRGFVVRNAAASRRRPEATKQKSEEFGNALAYINFSITEAATTYAFADALSCLFTVLGRLSMIKIPPRPYSNDDKRYEVRMMPFDSIGLPELIRFDDFTRQVAQPDESTPDLLKFAADSAAGAKKGFELLSKLSPRDAFCQGSYESWLSNVKACLKACIFTNITISSLGKAIEAQQKGGELKVRAEIPVMGKGYHDWWVVPTIIPVP